MEAVGVMLERTESGWAVTPTDGRELARFTGLGANRHALRYLADRRAWSRGRGGDLIRPCRHSGRAPGSRRHFSMRSFWNVECLARANRLEEAQLAFERMLNYANHVGLYSDQIGLSGELLGNFPQALTNLALISAAVRLDQALDDTGLGE
jgi:GH15 family glucan-1,4-alpha-glucosidase